MFHKLRPRYIYIYFAIWMSFNTIYFIFFTPPSSIVFYDMDSRIMIDEIIQILNPTSLYDFIYDTAYGGRIIYGRFFYNFYAFFVFMLDLFFSNYLSIPQIIMFINWNILFLSFLILNKVLIKNIYLKLFTLMLMLTFEISSIISLKTTSLEILILSLVVFYIYGHSAESDNSFKKSSFLLGILFGIKFINAPYLGVFLIFVILNKSLDQKMYIFLNSILGFLVAQPSVLIPQSLKVYTSDIIHHLSYQEGSYVSNFDWAKVIFRNFGNEFLLVIFITFLYSLYKNKYKFLFKDILMPLAALIQLTALLFSNGLIRAHYTKMPLILLLYLSFNLIEKNTNLKWFVFLVASTLIFNISLILGKSIQINILKYESIDKVDNTYLSLNQVVSMNKTLDYVQTISKQREIPLVWWGVSEGSFYYPYSKFHWGSSEDPQDSDFHIKELYEGPDGFAFGNCKNYGGIVVFILNKNNNYVVQELLDNEYQFLKKYEIQDNQQELSYGIFAKQNTGFPEDC